MNRLFNFFNNEIVLAVTVGLIIGSPFLLYAQQPKPDPTFKLNPEASKVFAKIDDAEAELQRQFQQLESQRATLLIGAGVPQDSRQCKADDKGIVICVKPEQAKANPEKK